MSEVAVAQPVASQQEIWHNTRGEPFHVEGWSASGAKTVVLVHHGLGEHIGRYDTFARALVPAGVSVWGYDVRGHGRSVGKKGDAEGLGQLAEDLDVLIPVLLERSGCERVVLLGHSMGAAAVLWYLLSRDRHPAIERVMISAPPLEVERTPVLRVKLAAARVLRKVSPSLTLPSGIPAEGISSVPAEVARYRADPRVHDKVSAQLGWSLLHDAPRIVGKAGALEVPVLLWHGVDDPVALVEGGRALAGALPNVDYHEIAGGRHESHHERPDIVEALFGRINWFVGGQVA